MAYASVSDLQERFGDNEILQLTDRDGDDSPDSGVADRALEDASATADSYLARRHDVPLSAAPAVLVAVVCDLARARLYDDNAPEVVTSRKDDALAWLKRVAKGEADVISEQGRVDTDAAPAVSTRSSGQRVFDRGSLKGFTN